MIDRETGPLGEADAALALDEARLPASREAARDALRACAEVDERAGRADRMAALASYAKQADDDELEKQRRRIRRGRRAATRGCCASLIVAAHAQR